MTLMRRILVAALVAPLTACAPDPVPTATAITNVTVIDAVNGLREHRTVIFDGDTITAVLPADDAVPPVARTIDGAGQFLIPGLWDMHVHLTYDARFTDAMPGMFLRYGITSVRDTGGLIPLLEPVVERMRAPDAVAPRVFYSGPLQDGRFVVYDGESRPEIGARNATPEDARASVYALADHGADFIKVYELVTPDVFDALVGAARERGLPVAAHVPLSMYASQAGPAVDSMEHLRNVELDCADNAAELYEARLGILNAHESGPGFELRSRLHELQRLPAIARYDEARCNRTIASLSSTIQVPTLRLNALALHPPFVRDDWPEGLAVTPADVAAEWKQAGEDWLADDEVRDTAFAEWSLSLVGRMHQAGVPIGAGTDTPIGYAIPGYSLHTELERLVEAGLAPIDAIGAATIRPAQFFSLQHEMGTIAPGMRADLVMLAADPLADIRNTRRIVTVVSKGRIIEPGL
jgi:predicted amidohydrolase YtcJ